MMKLILVFFLFLPAMDVHAQLFDRFLDRYGKGVLFDFSAYQTINASMAQELSNQTDPDDNGEYKYDISGQRYGLRLGFLLGRLVIGYGFSSGKFNYEFSGPDRPSSKGKATADLNEGFLMWRGKKFLPWVGYIWSGHGRIKDHDLKLNDAGGWSVGLGYKLTRWFQVNFEAKSYSFGEYSSKGSSVVVPPGGKDDFRVSEVSLGVSIALEFVSKGHN